MTRKRVLELVGMYAVVTLFGLYTYGLGAYHNALAGALEVELVGCEPPTAPLPTSELQPL